MDAVYPEDRLACRRCVGEPRLRAEIAELALDGVCDYCGREGACVDLAWLADRVHAAVQGGFVSVIGASARVAAEADAGAPLPACDDSRAALIDSQLVVADVGGFDDDLARDVHARLAALYRDPDGTTLYGPGTAYAEPEASPRLPLGAWPAFAVALEARPAAPVSADALDALQWAFAGLAERRTPKGRPALRVLAAGARVFRALPPTAVARMRETERSALFDGASDVATALDECRPPRDSSVVVVRFTLARASCVLDLRAARRALERASRFDADCTDARARGAFLAGLATALRHSPAIAEPWSRSRALRLVADWLAHAATPRCDGLVAEAGDGGGKRVVLFAPFAATGGLADDRERRYAIGGVRIRYRRDDAPSGTLADAEREQREHAEARDHDEFHGSSSLSDAGVSPGATPDTVRAFRIRPVPPPREAGS